MASSRETEGGEDAVFAGERDGVGDGGDGDQLEEAREQAGVEVSGRSGGVGLGLSVGEEQGVCEFEGDGGAAERFEGVGAAGLGWG